MLVMSMCEPHEDMREVNFQRGLQGEKSGTCDSRRTLGMKDYPILSLGLGSYCVDTSAFIS